MKKVLSWLLLLILLAQPALAKIDLVSLPGKEKTEVTIYRSTDLTLVREFRNLTLTEGVNHLQFDWSNTRIDPTSVRLNITSGEGAYRVRELSYPPGTTNTLVWEVIAENAGTAPVEISYFTLGLNWKANYNGLLSKDESKMSLDGYVHIENNSGETFQNAKTRLLMGKIHILDKLSKVIRTWRRKKSDKKPRRPQPDSRAKVQQLYSRARRVMEAAPKKKEITTEAVSEYYILSIEGRETLKNNWKRRLQFLEQKNIPLNSLYRYWPDRYGEKVVRLLNFTNDTTTGLGTKPLPAGTVRLVKKDRGSFLTALGESHLKYLPRSETAHLNLGKAQRVRVNSRLMELKTENFSRDNKGNLAGWEELKTYRAKCENFRSLPITLEVYRKFPHQYWQIQESSHPYTQLSYQQIKYKLKMKSQAKTRIKYKVKFSRGNRRD